MLLSNCASRHVTLYRFHQIQVNLISYHFLIDKIELLIGELYNQGGRCDRHARQLYGSVADNSGDFFFFFFFCHFSFFCHLFSPIYDFFVPNFIFLCKWRQWQSVRRTLLYERKIHTAKWGHLRLIEQSYRLCQAKKCLYV